MKYKKKQQFRIGKKIELENAHFFPKRLRNFMVEKITLDNLKEDKFYSPKLNKMEKTFKKK